MSDLTVRPLECGWLTTDSAAQRQVFAWLRAQEAAGTRLVYSHDPDQWATLGPTLGGP